MPESDVIPSISLSNVLKTLSVTLVLVLLDSLLPTITSTSSKKIIAGIQPLAFLKTSTTRN